MEEGRGKEEEIKGGKCEIGRMKKRVKRSNRGEENKNIIIL